MSGVRCHRLVMGGCALLLMAAQSVFAQQTWIVDIAQGPGTHFTSVQPAVDAAMSGDTILVRSTGVFPATHSYAAPVIDGKGLTIVGDGPDRTLLAGPFVIRNTGAADVTNLIGFMRASLGDVFTLMTVQQCQGPVVMRDLVFEGRNELTDCAFVAISNCRIRQFTGFKATRTALMIDSLQTLYDTVLTLYGWPPLRAIQSRVWIANSTLRGQSCTLAFGGWDAAIRTEDSDLWIGSGTTLIGGVTCGGASEVVRDEWGTFSSSCTIYTVPPSRVVFDPTVQLFGGYSLCRVSFEPVTSLWTTRAGNTLRVEQRCPPSSMTVLALGPQTLTPAPGLLAPLAVDLTQSILCMTPAPASGAIQLQFAIPAGLPPGFHIGLQAGAMDPSGALSLSNASVFAIW